MAKKSGGSRELTATERRELIETLKARFEAHGERHRGVSWEAVEARLAARPDRVWTLAELERSGGEPDVVAVDAATGEVVFSDCSKESPSGRRSVCFDDAALEARKANKPRASAVGMAAAMGAELLSEAEYRALQTLGTFDAKTSSWVQTPDSVRRLGGALFCDYRFGAVFVYHNGAESYYAARGFRCSLRV